MASPLMAAEQDCKVKARNMERWTICEQDKDCVIALNVCGSLFSLNAGYLSEFNEYNVCIGPTINCISPYQSKEKFIAKCEDHFCQLADKNIKIEMH